MCSANVTSGLRVVMQDAGSDPPLRAAVVYYGTAPTDEAAIAAIKARVLGNYGGDGLSLKVGDVDSHFQGLPRQ